MATSESKPHQSDTVVASHGNLNAQQHVAQPPKAPRVFQVPAGSFASQAGRFAVRGGHQDVIHQMSWQVTATASAAHSYGDPILVPGVAMGQAGRVASAAARPMSEAISEYLGDKQEEDENCARVVLEKHVLLLGLISHVGKTYPTLGADPWVHDICSFHLRTYIKELEQRKGKVRRQGEPAGKVAPRTIDKKIRYLIHFFGFCFETLNASNIDPSRPFLKLARKLKKRAARDGRHYKPFTAEHVGTIFSPEVYLGAMREPDNFWAPILAIHLGVRLGEILQLSVHDFKRDPECGVWHFYIDHQYAKNDNSIRRLPITQPLIDLGFIEYIDHVKGLGLVQLFPHRDYTSKTLERDPSKRVSERFAGYLDKVGITDVDLVFHSFRHTVVSALHDGGVSLSDAMQIVGHEAQEHAVRSGLMSRAQARSIHMSTYAGGTEPRLDVPNVLVHLKRALERCVRPDLDYAKLRIAADIVRQHLRLRLGDAVAGWPAQNRKYTATQAKLLGAAPAFTRRALD